MSFNFNSQMCHGEKEYKIQITTDNYEQFLFMQEKARECVDGEHKKCEHVWLFDGYAPEAFGRGSIKIYKCAKCDTTKAVPVQE